MKKTLLAAASCLTLLVATAAPLSAQLMPPNAAGVSLGAVYFTVPDVDKHKKIWVDIFGAKPVMVGKTEMLKFPGALIVLQKGTAATTAGFADHLGIWAKDLKPLRAKLTAGGIETAANAQFVNLPDGVKLEFIDDPAGPDSPAAQHVHYFDRDTKLLKRMVRMVPSPVGRVSVQVDYSDYRDVGGVKFPFEYLFSWMGGRYTAKIKEVKTNVAIDAAKFAKP